MSHQLVAISGPRRGITIAVPEREVTIGRDTANWLTLDSNAVSRQHCQLRRVSDGFAIVDLESLNGTFVNGVPIKERVFRQGDVIGVGDSVFLFARREAEPPQSFRHVEGGSEAEVSAQAAQPAASSTVAFDKPSKSAGLGTTRMSTADLLSHNPEELIQALPSGGRVQQDLQALLQVARAIGSRQGLEVLEQQLLEAVLEIVPAERAAVFLIDRDPNQFVSIFGRHRESGPDCVVQVSRGVIHRVLKEGAAVLGNDFPNSRYASAESEDARVQAVLAVPLKAFDKVRGVIYLDSCHPNARFDDHHLRLLSAVGSIAAIPLENARQIEQLQSENKRLQEEINIEHNMVGESPEMQKVYRFIAKVAPTDSTVLISGESGTGKELVARAIHSNSPRAEKPFVAINCAALTETLLESELFGHEKGAFTGAIEKKKGKLEVADQGTVFLDEIGELAPQLQAKLLRVLQDHTFDRVGGTRPVRVDVRLIAATNRDLKKEVEKGNFREDLYYRLNVVSIKLPALRERREDIPLLIQYFLNKHAHRAKRSVMGLSPEVRRCLMAYDWTGNVRELENAIERAVVLGASGMILPEDLPEVVLESKVASAGSITQYHEAVNETKKRLILQAIERARGNFTEAAKSLGLHPNYLHRLVRNLDLRGKIEERSG